MKEIRQTEASELLLKIGSLWREQKEREFLYLEALKKDKMGPMRNMLSQGHISALLFQKEIQALYDYFKSFLNDKDLRDSLPTQYVSQNGFYELEEKEQVAGYLKRAEGRILQSYNAVYKHLERDSEMRRIIDTHLVRITEFCDFLAKHEGVKLKELKPI